MPQITMRELLEAGVHFGHQTQRWNPKMKPYVFGARNGIYIIDLQKTVDQTRAACAFASKVTSEGKKVLFVGTKKQAKDVIEEEAKRAGMHYVTNRWLGGMLTNYQTVKASIDRLKKIEALKDSPEWNETPKKEQARYDRELEKLKKSLGGIEDMKKLPGALFVVDTMKDGGIHLVFNTTEGAQALKDSMSIRRTALMQKIPYYTTIAGAAAAVQAISALRTTVLDVAPLQLYAS